MWRLFPILLVFITTCSISAQSREAEVSDSVFNPVSAWKYVDEVSRNKELWRSNSDSVLKALKRLLDHSSEPYDSVSSYLKGADFSTIPVNKSRPPIAETLDVKWINDSTFVLDKQGWNPDLYLKEEERYTYPVELSSLSISDSIPDKKALLDSTLFTGDTIIVQSIDTAAIQELGIGLYSYLNDTIAPPLFDTLTGRVGWLSRDKSKVYFRLPGTIWIADENSPFYILKDEKQLDSLQLAINTLLDYNLKRDSTLLFIDDMFGKETPYWLTGGRDETFRLWVKNFNNDSLSLWVGNPGTRQISLLLEDDVNFNRLVRQNISYLPTFLKKPQGALQEMSMLEPEPKYWEFQMANILGLNQTYLSNWSKGGESTLATTIDVTGKATYNNKDAGTQWISLARMKFGTIWTKDKGNRINSDDLELDSKYNLNAWGKIGFSASFYMKTQIAKGFNYPNDSVAVSKFLNPGTITVGLGAEYKPMEKTTINIAPLSYKTTFVLDTANIDQKRHGVAANQISKRELGLQLVLYNEIKPYKDLTMINKVRFFSNYLYKPQNVDVDWEMILEQRISWFLAIRLNLHLIYDDDVRFPVYDENGDAILLPDGSAREAAKPQFREFLGLTLSLTI